MAMPAGAVRCANASDEVRGMIRRRIEGLRQSEAGTKPADLLIGLGCLARVSPKPAPLEVVPVAEISAHAILIGPASGQTSTGEAQIQV
ncbi:hypothetical protein AXG93_2396s1410 [Marchantia polymorpha subsp. ruderalis]|uniref:Uncharacterized protein n=1 Tax=Marchantia polymorpha subsp. ruderalis TaxID=1480154 RepID=A0A176VCZ4_MARPO|nr:hypothetical protein AXG93_2396s1410 [Marchantia polymorpha subsp. ruderalis]